MKLLTPEQLDAKLHAVNTADGTARWTYRLGAEVRASSPAVDGNGVIYLGAYDNRLYAVNADGTLRRTYDVGHWIRSCPAIHGTTIYVGSNDRKLYAWDLGASAAPASPGSRRGPLQQVYARALLFPNFAKLS
jgi:outer membrane protein assembly factor BamB